MIKKGYGDLTLKKKDTHLTRSLKNDRSNKDLLRTEINNATDPNVRLELTKMLVSIENKEKRKRKFVWSIVLILLMTILVFLLWLGNKSNPKDAMITTIVSNTSSEIKEPTNTTTTESIISETDLTEEQLKEWVMSILDLLPPPPTKYILNVTIDDTDNLAYIFVGIDQLDSLGSFRVNAKGELEANGPITGVMGRSNWTLMSSKYLDTSIASKYFDDRELEKIKIDDSINSTKQLLIGEKYSIAPILYDGIDATEAMNDGKAPQNKSIKKFVFLQLRRDSNGSQSSNQWVWPYRPAGHESSV